MVRKSFLFDKKLVASLAILFAVVFLDFSIGEASSLATSSDSNQQQNFIVRIYKSISNFFDGFGKSENFTKLDTNTMNSTVASDTVIESNSVLAVSTSTTTDDYVDETIEPAFFSTSNNFNEDLTLLQLFSEITNLRNDLELKIRDAKRTAEIAIGNTRSYVDRQAQNVTNTTVVQSGGSSDANSLTGSVLAPNVLTSSLTSLGTISNLNATAATVGSLDITGLSNTVLAVDGSGNVVATTTGGGGGLGTINSGLTGQIPFYSANGTTVSGTSTIFVSNEKATISTLALTGLSSAVLAVDQSGNVISTTTSGGGGMPGGSDTQVQFNDGGSFGGVAGFVFNKVSSMLGIGTSTPTSNLTVDGSFHTSCETLATSTSMTIDFSTAKNCLIMAVGSANVAVTFTNANLVLGKRIELSVVAPLSGNIGSTTFSGGSGSGVVVPAGGVNLGNSIVNGSTDTFSFTSTASTSAFFIRQKLEGTY